MKINGTDIKIFGAKQHRVEYGHQSASFSNEWVTGSVLPYMGYAKAGFKQVTVTVVMRGSTRAEIIRNRSGLLALLRDPVLLDLDKNAHHFYCVLKSHRATEVNQGHWHNMELTFEGYECGDDVSASGQSEITIENPGNTVSPCTVIITPGITAASVTLTGICVDPIKGTDIPVTVTELEAGEEIRIDGITGLVTQGEELKDVDLWILPAVLPGETTVTCDNRMMGIEIFTRPLFM